MGLFNKKKKIDNIPEFPTLPEELPSYEPELPHFKPHESERISEPRAMPPLEIPLRRQSSFSERPLMNEHIDPMRAEKPLFIKIDSYKEAIANIDLIKEKIKEADEVLNKLYNLRAEEEKELTQWHVTLNKIKEKLITVDKKLFES